ncbi:MAG: hypothetical protein ACTHLK_14875 [Brucella intermedia]
MPGDPEDYPDFLLRFYDLTDDAREMDVSTDALHLLKQAAFNPESRI